MSTRNSINRMNYESYRSLWGEFWFHKLGYYPSNGIEKIVKRVSVKDARKADIELEKEFINFYKNKIGNESPIFRRKIKKV